MRRVGDSSEKFRGRYKSGMPLDESGERADVVGRPRTHDEQAHLARYEWAVRQARGTILDAACGTGYGSSLLASVGTVCGVDYSEEALALAQARLPNGRFVVARLPDVPFPDGSFDTVVSFETIEHIKDDRALLREFARVLRPGGLLLLSTPNREREGARDNPFHEHEYVLEELVTLVAEAGFTGLEISYQGTRHLSRAGRQVLRVVARFPVLCRPGRWWDVIAHGHDEVTTTPQASIVIFLVMAHRGY